MGTNTIQAKGTFIRDEKEAAADLLPGLLVELNSDDKYAVHSEANGIGECAIVVENALEGLDVDTAIDSGEVVQVNIQNKGSEFYARIVDGATIVIGDFLCSNGNGYWRKYVEDSSTGAVARYPIAVARDACDMSGSSAVDPSPLCLSRAL